MKKILESIFLNKKPVAHRGLTLISALLGAILSSCSLIYEDGPYSSENSDYVLYMKNYLGNIQNIHPKVLYFEEGWNGYEFWMAYTPYPKGKVNAENPCIAASHDGVVWTTPKGLKNPLATAPPDGYNSDTHLVYDEANDRMECWWRAFDENSNSDSFYSISSSDGVNWSERRETLSPGDPYKMRLSPAVWISDSRYNMVYCDGRNLQYVSSPVDASPLQWSEPVRLPVDWGSLKPWHQDLITDENGDWELVVCAYQPGGNNNTADLYYVKIKKDFEETSVPYLILKRGENISDFDHRSIYRSSLVKVGDEYWLYYSSINEKWERFMALLRGPSVFELRPLTDQEMRCSD